MKRPVVGQLVVAVRPIWFPGQGDVAPTGARGEIVGLGVDASFGVVQVRWPGQPEGTVTPTWVAPWCSPQLTMARMVEP